MRSFTFFVSLPALTALGALALIDRTVGNRRLWRAAVAGAVAGLLAAVAYDVFRLPFVYANDLGIQRFVPALKLFKVFPRFGAMLLGQPIEQTHYTIQAQLLGWGYHFSNGVTFGIMYVTLLNDPAQRHWAWGVVFAVGLELGMLFTPYPAYFQIPLTVRFVVVTLAAHAVFGIVMGRTTLRLWKV